MSPLGTIAGWPGQASREVVAAAALPQDAAVASDRHARMLFSSIVFLFYFVPIFFALYYATGRSNVVLLAGSLVFYAWGELRYLWLLGLVCAVTWVGGQAVAHAQNRGGDSRVPLGVAVAALLAMLGWFKYANFVADQFRATPLPAEARWALPLGISFFTFHAISYLMDIHRRTVAGPASPLRLGVYMTMFPQLVAGPIVRYAGVAAQIERRRTPMEAIASGIRLFALGLAQKVLLANTLAGAVDPIFASPPDTLSPAAAWLGAVGYMLQLYFDFGGYSLMAIGLGRMLGLTFPRNFDAPYASQSITEFWRRWHMSLSSWFRDYVYIPLGGNRRGTWRTYANLWAVFLLCGLWHGAAWTFVLWGAYHGAFLMLERAGLGGIVARLWRPLRHAYALLVVLFGWVLFRADTLAHAWGVAGAMLGRAGAPQALDGRLLTPSVVTALAVGVVASWPWAPTLRAAASRTGGALSVAGSAALAVLLALSAASLATGTYNPFIYFRF